MDDTAGAVRQKPDAKVAAIKTGLPGGGREWFVFDPFNGGYYTSGEVEKLDTWTPLEPVAP